MRNFIQDEMGATLIEYGLIIAILAVIGLTAAFVILLFVAIGVSFY